MADLLTKARTGRANALKSLSSNRTDGPAPQDGARRHLRPSQPPMFMSVRGHAAPQSDASARSKAEHSFLASAMTQKMPDALVH